MGVDGQRHAAVTLPREREPVPIVQDSRWAPGQVWTGAEKLVPTGIRSPDCRTRSVVTILSTLAIPAHCTSPYDRQFYLRIYRMQSDALL
jgi:hypothetical protein